MDVHFVYPAVISTKS